MLYLCNIYFIEKGNGNPLQYLCLENSMVTGAWRVIAHRVTNVRHEFVVVRSLSCVRLSVTAWTVANNQSTPGFPVLHCLPEFSQTHVH